MYYYSLDGAEVIMQKVYDEGTLKGAKKTELIYKEVWRLTNTYNPRILLDRIMHFSSEAA